VAGFATVPRGRIFRRPRNLAFPLIVKSLTFDASIGISQASVVESEENRGTRTVHTRASTDALVETTSKDVSCMWAYWQ
jgi:D-alanine-D-alanine ligase